eukprot:TRINITY_DN110688_c0_g1_i1.p1 TRINITY_DN110688_c0_g1~~TRINITY_DN110688_c0_g1_i1.p1  ORF type:complete len:366 (+),score=67.10 TRINITY_DN110688_c0_g1_i1:186-1283(+)
MSAGYTSAPDIDMGPGQAGGSSSSSASAGAATDPLRAIPRSPVVVLMIGMAGSGKSTWMHRLVVRLQSENKRVYTVNLDPAVRNVAYPVNVDIRDTVNYKEVMKHFGLGPNGAIMTSLNLFATKFDQVLTLLDKRAPELDYVLVDTPGQIEVFNWSASGQIICDALAVSYPTVVCYVTDTARCVKPVTFMSNMLYACSILYKTKLPFIVAFNKIDVMPHGFLEEWMQDFEKVGEALSKETSYVASLAKSMSLAMEEFYSQLRSVGVSAVTGQGCSDFEKALLEAREEFHTSYVPFLMEQRREIEEKRKRAVEEQIKDFRRGLDKAKAKRSRNEGDEDVEVADLQRSMEDVCIGERRPVTDCNELD